MLANRWTAGIQGVRDRLTPRPDVALLLLRLATGVSLLVGYGIQKVGAAIGFLQTGHWAFVDFNRHVGLPFPVTVALLQTLNESLGAGLLAAGLLARYAGATLAFGFAVATGCSLRVGEPAWASAAVYCVLAAAVMLGGPGRYSVEYWLKGRRERRSAPVSSP